MLRAVDADPVISSSGNLTVSGANAYTLDLGTAVQGSAALVATLTAGNNATGPADWLNGSWTVNGGAAFANSGFGSFSALNRAISIRTTAKLAGSAFNPALPAAAISLSI